MTIKELSQLYYLKREIEQYEDRLKKLKATVTNTTSQMTGMPHSAYVSDKVGKVATEIAYISEAIENKKHQCWAEYHRLTDYINGIDDSLTRQIFTNRFVKGQSWGQVAGSIGGNSGDSCRMIVKRYIQK